MGSRIEAVDIGRVREAIDHREIEREGREIESFWEQVWIDENEQLTEMYEEWKKNESGNNGIAISSKTDHNSGN